MHVIAIGCLLALSLVVPLGADLPRGCRRRRRAAGVRAVAVTRDDLSQVKRAFDLNGYVGILYLLVLAASIYGRLKRFVMPEP